MPSERFTACTQVALAARLPGRRSPKRQHFVAESAPVPFGRPIAEPRAIGATGDFARVSDSV